MTFFYLNKVDKKYTEEKLKSIFLEFGDIDFMFLKSDDYKNFKHGGINFSSLVHKEDFLECCKHLNIKPKENNLKKNQTHQKVPETRESTSTIKNPSYNYYRDNNYGRKIEDFIWSNQHNSLFKIPHADNSVKLTTIYPGLLIGSGYNHPTKGNKDDYQLGFFFDHTTGLPLITGSSIKGVLNSLFKDDNKFDYLKEVYGIEEEREPMQKRLFKNGETVFYDAYIIGTNNDGKIFASDYITSHYSDDPMGQFKEPNPVKFLKILPEVTWQFQFKAEKKDIELFEKIILDFGLGAKTNVGYGQFRE